MSFIGNIFSWIVKILASVILIWLLPDSPLKEERLKFYFVARNLSMIHLGLSSSHYEVLNIFREIADVVVLSSGCCWHWVQQHHRDTGGWPDWWDWQRRGLPGHHEQVSKPRALLGITSPSHNQPWPTGSQSVRVDCKQENYANTLVTPK